ncbi:MAG: hypothetical protein A2289_20960 [Deltaproteobacteria bacterium RIFOXYA12_FULL_58_15]|nr:MAG: hypothetical protein A2289_20960 [Deltaproteobacteria bacterium RIFOXYA12_FULL_58_15]
MSRAKKGLRIPIRLRLLGMMAIVLLGTMAVYLSLATKLIADDRLTYAFDLNQKLVSVFSAQVRGTIESTAERLRLYGNMAVVERSIAAKNDLAERMLLSENDLLRIQLYLQNASGELVPVVTRVAEERLLPLEITAVDLAELDRSRPLPLASIGREQLLVANRSLPPSASLLTVAVAPRTDGVPPWVVCADVVPEKLLGVFAGSSLYAAYLVDFEGRAVAHPDVQKVVGRESLASTPVVRAALGSHGTRSGALEYDSGDGRALLGSWAHVGVGRLSVITEADRDEALAAAYRLVRLSILFAVAVVLAAIFVTIVVARRLTTPIRKLSVAAAELARGNYDIDPDVHSGDEIEDLADDFREMGREIRAGQVRLAQSAKLAAFGQLGAGITHEIKNPLGSIRGFAQLGLRAINDANQTRESFQIIEKETERCLEIVQNFLKFARKDPGKRAVVAVNDVVADGLKLVAHQLSTSQVRLHRELGEAPPVCVAARQIHQVLLNLLLNAEHAVGQKGEIWVSTATLDDGRVEIVVRDNGPGIPADVLPKIFDPFFTTKGEGKGTGLGLSVSYGIVAEHGGELIAESEPDAGATFRIRLPVATPQNLG